MRAFVCLCVCVSECVWCTEGVLLAISLLLCVVHTYFYYPTTAKKEQEHARTHMHAGRSNKRHVNNIGRSVWYWVHSGSVYEEAAGGRGRRGVHTLV